jgi:hypothetical protein
MAQHYIRKAVRGRARALIGDAPDACLALQANKRHAWTHISFNEGMGGTLLNARLRLENRKKTDRQCLDGFLWPSATSRRLWHLRKKKDEEAATGPPQEG